MSNRLATFAARARVIDLLGREQIADAPTAISELLKNAIDAGAKDAAIRYNTNNKFLEIEDDGLGMRLDDLLNKWLVVATESKRGAFDTDWLEYADKEQKTAITGHKPFGEKGIGRLAVSSLGRAVLVWTRWGRGTATQRTLMLVHWNLFQHPRLTLEDIKVPYLTIKNRPTQGDLHEIFSTLAQWLRTAKKWETPHEKALQAQILDDLEEKFPHAVKTLSSFGTDSGTLFAILGTTPEVDESLRSEVKTGELIDVAEGVKVLMGFSDPFGEQKRKLGITIEVDAKPVHADRRFWKADDLRAADHQIDLSIGADGFVKGKVRRFNQNFDYEYQAKPLDERQSSPGPFRVVLGYVAGTDSESRLPDEQRKVFDQRLRAYGALYVYRDGVRLLPYGRTDQDFLNFEVRRSYNAGRYFFSHRRMFGAIYLTSEQNSELREKAGREGFIKNGAYRGFQDTLVDIFIDLAKTYFSTDPLIEKPTDRRKPNRQAAAERLKRRADNERSAFLRDLESWRRRLPLARRQMQTLFEATEDQIRNAETQQGYRGQRVQAIYDLVDRCGKEFALLIADMGTERPKLSALSRTEQQVFDSYLTDRQAFEEETIKKIAQFSARCGQIAKSIIPDKDRLAWIEQRIKNARQAVRQTLDDEIEEIALLCERLNKQEMPAWRKAHEGALSRIIDDATENRDSANESAPDSPERLKAIVEALTRMEIELREVYLPFWHAAKGQIENLRESEGSEELLGDLYRRTEVLEEQSRVLGELAQLGLIVESMDHEYRSLFYNVEQNLRHIAGYVRPEGRQSLEALTASLASLETKQNMLMPLHQRKTSATFDVSGADIRNFIEKLYPESRRQGTKIEYTPDFLKTVLRNANQATLFASVANLVANSLYWVSKSSRTRAIRLSTFGGGLLLSDSGPGIAPRDRPRIFEAFFGRRPNGRGLGLYIAKTNLEAVGYRLRLLEDPPSGTLTGANFLISPPE